MKSKALFVVCLLLLTSCDSGVSQKELIDKATKGDAAAQLSLYELYRTGRAEGGKNYEEAIKWLEKSAGSGNAKSQYILGSIYSNGSDGVIKNSQESAKWHELAVQNGNKDALFSTAMNYQYGWGVKHDPIKAYAYLLIAESFDDKNARLEDPKFRYSLTQPQREESESLALKFREKYFKK